MNETQTLRYTLGAKHHMGPVIEGYGCTFIGWCDVPAERDAAFSLLARMADKGNRMALNFLKEYGYEHTYGTLIE